ncbi:MAG TPA: hypothetical protein VKY45_13485, partial [Marinilabiliaceae bacterium]|nr:hypothetical protein [Marinilabiliaceae bacterium]
FLKEKSVRPDEINSYLISVGSAVLKQGCKLHDLISRPQVSLLELAKSFSPLQDVVLRLPENRREEILESTEIIVKYAGYIEREKLAADKLKRLEKIKIKDRFNYSEIKTISTEGRQKLEKINPETIGQASRISGVNPSDINVLLVLLGR